MVSLLIAGQSISSIRCGSTSFPCHGSWDWLSSRDAEWNLMRAYSGDSKADDWRLFAWLRLRYCPAFVVTAIEIMKSDNWHFTGFTRVLAFQINWRDPFPDAGILEHPKPKKRWFAWPRSSGRSDTGLFSELNPTRKPSEGVELSSSQIQRLCHAVCSEHKEQESALCFDPHHAFLFVDESNSIVGNIDICFHCSTYRSKPDGFAENWDLSSISELYQELGLKITNPFWHI